jgi:hypothetical protein
VSRVRRASHFENPDSAFVGRKQELSILGAALQRARSGLGSIFLVSGEAGTGKTLLVREFSAFARTAGAKVLEGRASLRFRDVPFGVWKQILSDQPHRYDGSPAVSRPIDAASALTLSAPLPSVDRQIEPELFETTARALVEYAETQPLVLVLDDLHAADALSLQAFGVLARELSHAGTLLIGIYRDSEIKRFHEFDDLLHDPLIRESKRISLAAFNAQETLEFAQSRSVGQLEEGAMADLHSLTEGNPRLMEIALQHRLLDDTSLGPEKWLGGMLRADIEAHLEHLSEATREVLSTASVAGAAFGIATLYHVLDKDPRELLDSLYEAGRSGLLRPTEIPGSYRFRQALVQEILYAELSGARRARLHQRFGEVLESLHPHDIAYVEKIATHFYEAALLGCADKAADYCSRAAIHAYGESRITDGLRFYQMAMVALELQRSNPNAIADLKARLEEARSPSLTGSFPNSSSAGESAIAAPRPAGNRDPEIGPKSSADRHGVFSPAIEGVAPIPSPRSGPMQENTFRREGDFWTLVFEERVLRLKHSNGLLFVAHLLRNPDYDFHVAQLLALLPSVGANHAGGAYISRSDKERLGMHTVSAANSNPLLDPTAKAEYKRRIEELREAVNDARALNDAARAADLERELEFLALELSRAVGVGGRDRKHRAEDERARVNVTNAIRALTARIVREHSSFGRYLRLTIRTGHFCSYRPDPCSAPRWEF